ncbi:unnamed protein product, partial [Iphiclides podalirius]
MISKVRRVIFFSADILIAGSETISEVVLGAVGGRSAGERVAATLRRVNKRRGRCTRHSHSTCWPGASTCPLTRPLGLSMRTLARRGLSAGAASAAFSADHLRRALHRSLLASNNVHVELDGSGRLCGRGGAAKGAGGAAGAEGAEGAAGAPEAAVSARLAPAAPAAALLLCASTAAPAGSFLRLRLQADVAPLQELQLWFDEATLALLDMPVLSLHNIQGKKNYVCHECGSEFEQPNPLKVHLFLCCREYSPAAFWECCCERLKRPIVPRSSAFQPYHKGSAVAAAWPLLTLPAAEHAAVEALAAAWGRARGAHACLYCGKLYSRKYGLKIHIRTHTGYKPLRCRYCLRAFGDPSNLNKHVRLHASRALSTSPSGAVAPSAPHACPHCAKPLARRRDLERHLRARHAHPPQPSHSPPAS